MQYKQYHIHTTGKYKLYQRYCKLMTRAYSLSHNKSINQTFINNVMIRVQRLGSGRKKIYFLQGNLFFKDNLTTCKDRRAEVMKSLLCTLYYFTLFIFTYDSANKSPPIRKLKQANCSLVPIHNLCMVFIHCNNVIMPLTALQVHSLIPLSFSVFLNAFLFKFGVYNVVIHLTAGLVHAFNKYLLKIPMGK